MILQNQPSIEDFFDFENKDAEGKILMYEWAHDVKNRLYIVNRHRKKLLQFIVKDEPDAVNPTFAQIKIIPYAVKHAKVYKDQPEDPSLFRIHKKFDLTYHGGSQDNKTPKVHLKIADQSRPHYKTLVDCSLCLDSSTPLLVPVYSFFPGDEFDKFDKPLTDTTGKKPRHIFQVDSSYPIRFDFYLSGKDFDFDAYFNSMYSMNILFSLDYLIAKENSPFRGGPIVQPITGFAMKGYYIWVRCSKSTHVGKPFIQFYNNDNYYKKVMNRPIAYTDSSGSSHYSTMLEREREFTDYLNNQKNKR